MPSSSQPEHNAAAHEPVSTRQTVREEKLGRIKCHQCSEYYAKSTTVCPRCGRWNSRSPLAVCLKALLVLVVAVILFATVKVITEAAGKSRSEMTGHENSARAGTHSGAHGSGDSDKGDQPEVKFNR